MPNLQCQKDVPDHNYLLEPKGPENFWGLPCIRTHLVPVSTTANTFCLFLGCQWIVSIIICNNPHLEAILDWILYQGHGKCPVQTSLWGLWWSRQGVRDGEGLNCFSGFNILHKWTNVAGGSSIISGGVMGIRKSNHICFWVTFTGTLIAIEIGFWFLEFPLFFGSSLKPLFTPGICQFSSDQQWIAQYYKYLVPWWGSAWISVSHVLGVDWTILAFTPAFECGPIRALKDRNVDSLSPFQLPRNLLYLLYWFPGSQVPRVSPLIRPSFLAD